MSDLKGKIAWVTGAGSGMGEASALALGAAGVEVVLTGRRQNLLESVAERIKAAGGKAHVQAGDITDAMRVAEIAQWIATTLKRIDILFANAGANIPDRQWTKLKPQGVDEVISANLNSAYYCISAVLPTMRAQKDGVIIVTASIAGRIISNLAGTIYTAAKHGVVALCHTVNREECIHNIRCTALLPGEVATPILDKRPVPVSAEDRAKMVQSEDIADLVRYIAALPPRVVLNEVWITPTWNRAYVAELGVKP